MQLDIDDFRYRLKIQYKESEAIMNKLRQIKMEKEGFNLDEDAKKETERGLKERMIDVNYYREELMMKYDHKTEEELMRMMFSIDIDLEEDPNANFDDILPYVDDIEKIYLVMPALADFTDILEDYNKKVYPKGGYDDKIYRFTENSIDMKIRKVVEKCVKCKKSVNQTHFISETVTLPKYIIIYSNKNEEKRIVMPDRLKPFKKKCLYELKGFIVIDEKDKQKITNELTAYFRKDKNTWIKMFNSRKEIEYMTEIKMKQGGSLISAAESMNNELEQLASEKVSGGFKVNFEDQYLHKYLYKGVIYKLIGK